MKERSVPEIVIGFVAPSGTDFDRVTKLVSDRLGHYGYQSVSIRLSVYLQQRAEDAGRLDAAAIADQAARTRALQEEGNRFREETGRKDALALVAVNEVFAERAKKNEGTTEPGIEHPGMVEAKHLAYLIWSFKRPEEIATLRGIYGSRFFVFSVYTPGEKRISDLATRIAKARHRMTGANAKDKGDAELIVEYDAHEDAKDDEFGQNVRDAYPIADFFIGPDEASVERAVDIIFGHPFLTPANDEFGMFVANAAALRSAELGRQVGAAVTNKLGDVLATGFNEVPSPGGGQYSMHSPEDHREFMKGEDSSDKLRQMLVDQIEDELKKAGLLADPESPSGTAIGAALRATHIRGITEFGRALHAEASTFMDAARRGVPLLDQTMYVTTFPCHQCTRQVIAAGIKRLVYIYPYAKSLAETLHGDAIHLGEDAPAPKVPFEPFVGVAPRRYVEAFTAPERKLPDGTAVLVDDPARSPRLSPGDDDDNWEAGSYLVREQKAIQRNAHLFTSDEVATSEPEGGLAK